MSGVRARTRAVIFRVTEEEYAHLKKACSAGGGRSLSDFTRLKLLGPPAEGVSPAFSQVAEKLDELKAAVQQLTSLVAKS
jgi:hypothetical protein